MSSFVVATGTFAVTKGQDGKLKVVDVETKTAINNMPNTNNATGNGVVGNVAENGVAKMLKDAVRDVAKNVLQYAHNKLNKAAGNNRELSIEKMADSILLQVATHYGITIDDNQSNKATPTIDNVSTTITTLIDKLENYKNNNFKNTYQAARNLNSTIIPCLSTLSETVDKAETLTNKDTSMQSIFRIGYNSFGTASENLKCIKDIRDAGTTAYEAFQLELAAFIQQKGGQNRRQIEMTNRKSRIKKTNRRKSKRAHIRTH